MNLFSLESDLLAFLQEILHELINKIFVPVNKTITNAH